MPQIVRKTKKISADEARNLRKDQMRTINGKDAVIKATKPPMTPASSWDPEARTARFVMTAEIEDRYGDIVVTQGIDTDNFLRNPVAPLCHQTRTWPIGQWGGLEKMLKTRPPRMEGDLILLPAGGPVKEVDEAAFMLENGVLRACSIGFMPDWGEIEGITDDEGHWTGLQFNKSELLECSPCIIPANQEALIKMQAAGFGGLARELIEDTLDNYDRSPAGVLVSRADLEKMMKDLNGQRTTVFVGKLVRKPDEIAADMIGQTVNFDAAKHKGDVLMDAIGYAKGKVVDAYLVDDKIALDVLFENKDGFSGLVKGLPAADAYTITEKEAGAQPPAAEKSAEPTEKDPATEQAGKETAAGKSTDAERGAETAKPAVSDDKIKEFLSKRVKKDSSLGFGTTTQTTVKDGAEIAIVKNTMVVDGEILELAELSSDRKKMIIGEFEGIKQKLQTDSPSKLVGDVKLKLIVDTEEAESVLEKLSKSFAGFGEKIRVALDGLTTRDAKPETERVPPKLMAAPTTEEVAAAKAEAAEVLKRLAQAG